MSINNLQNLTLYKIISSENRIMFYTTCDRKFLMYHNQDCCEDVYIDDISGNLFDLIDSPLIIAEETIDSNRDHAGFDSDESFTWTFYKLATNKGYVTIKWYGSSNGYYSESASFEELKD